ncbi:hypothetical protein Ctob_016584 [Chrysochromulina tobinii]|uniref:Uncharacterized protein n=1 Tax=Chrysochromulina tobinii TaxID=1460289 RepID=A0A0M0LSC7_9EUKA|nr:hypothetical protein Ctob_016584 [Chrysochromulina tobinii]|eukprot:KOO53648.1 hypothetical protein Ctob_016584 [Chrysochromulina sp. CCMP291]
MLGSAAIDNLVAFATTWDGGMKKRWIVYNIHAMTAKDLELLAQELAPKLEVDRVVVLRALLAMVSLRKAGWQEPSASSLSGTHAGMPDFTRLVSFLGAERGLILDTGLFYDQLQPGLLTEGLELAKFLRMELSAPAMGLVHCADRSEAAACLKVGDPRVANELVHSDQLAARAYFHRAKVLDPPAASYGGEGPEQVLGFFVSGMDSPSLCYVVVRAVPALLEGAERRTPATQTRSDSGGAFVRDRASFSDACNQLAAILLEHAACNEREVVFDFATRGQNAFNLGLHLAAAIHTRHTVGGVSWLPAKLFDLEHDPWMGLPCTPRPKVRYFGTDETVLSEEMVLQHAIARQLQSSLSARKQAAELLRVFRAQKDPLATARHLRGETVVGVSDAEGAPEVAGGSG